MIWEGLKTLSVKSATKLQTSLTRDCGSVIMDPGQGNPGKSTKMQPSAITGSPLNTIIFLVSRRMINYRRGLIKWNYCNLFIE